MPFWTAVDGAKQDPKRESRFVVQVGALDNEGTVWYAKSCTKPSATIKTTAHRYLNHTFNYPGSVEWGDVTIELVDPTDPIDTAGSLAQLLEAMGYQIPNDNLSLVNISKRKAATSVGAIYISHIDDEGLAIETWQLLQPIITKFEWGSLKYDSDNLNTLKLTIKYDWATCELADNNQDPVEAEKAVTTGGGDSGVFFYKRPTGT